MVIAMKNKKILITGGAGFIGTNLSKKLIKDNDVTIIDLNKPKYGDWIKADVKKNNWFGEVGKVDYIFHFAAINDLNMSIKSPSLVKITESRGIKNIVHFANQINAKAVIYSSSASIYNPKKNVYNTSKLDSENHLKENCDVPYLILRIFNIYGSYMNKSVVYNFIHNALKNQPLVINGSGNQTRDFIYVKDSIQFIIEKLKLLQSSQIVDVGSGVETSVNKLANLIIKLTDSKSKVIYRKITKQEEVFEIERSKTESPLTDATPLLLGLREVINYYK